MTCRSDLKTFFLFRVCFVRKVWLLRHIAPDTPTTLRAQQKKLQFCKKEILFTQLLSDLCEYSVIWCEEIWNFLRSLWTICQHCQLSFYYNCSKFKSHLQRAKIARNTQRSALLKRNNLQFSSGNWKKSLILNSAD